MAYTMEYAEKVEPSDEVVEDKGARHYRPQGGAVPARHRDGLQSRETGGAICVQQPEPDVRLRLRRIGATHTGHRNALISTRHADGVREMLAVSLLKTRWLSEFE